MRLVDHKSNFTSDKGVLYMHDTISRLASQAPELRETGRKRRAADIVAPWLDKHLSDAQRSRFRHCGDYLVFLETDDRTKRKLDVGFFCGIRLCPGCAWRESIRNAERVASISGALADQGRVMLMVTLTVPNVGAEDLRRTVQHINRSWIRLLKRQRYAVWADSIRKLEITYNRTRDDYHPHLHCIVYVPKSYYGKRYISQQQLLQDWREVTGTPGITQVDVRRCRDRGTTNAVLEVAKYSAKASDYSQSEEVLDTMYGALHHTRLMTYAGKCKALSTAYDGGELEEYKQLDTTRYTMRVVYVWQRLDDGSWAYCEHDAQPYDMDETELDRLRHDEERAVAYAMEAAARQESWSEWMRTDWVRALRDADPDELEVAE